MNKRLAPLLLLAGLILGGCTSGEAGEVPAAAIQTTPAATASALPEPSPFPTRPHYAPGERVDYTAQTGDTLAALATRFNSSVEEILDANPFIPADATTMPPGMPMQIPIYYLPLWGSPYPILPDWLYINGPAEIGFDTVAFVDAQPGWLKDHVQYAAGANRRGGEIVEHVALNFSVSPRLLLEIGRAHV